MQPAFKLVAVVRNDCNLTEVRLLANPPALEVRAEEVLRPGAGMAYERVLLEDADKRVKQQLIDAANRMLPEFAAHALWRPKAREFIGNLMEARDRERLREELNHGVRLANSLGLDVSDVRLPAG